MRSQKSSTRASQSVRTNSNEPSPRCTNTKQNVWNYSTVRMSYLRSSFPISHILHSLDHMMAALNKAGLADRKYPELDSLFFKFQGSNEAQKEASTVVKK